MAVRAGPVLGGGARGYVLCSGTVHVTFFSNPHARVELSSTVIVVTITTTITIAGRA